MSYLSESGSPCREPLSAVAGRQFEWQSPFLPLQFRYGQRNRPGWWWASTTRRLVEFGSWLQRDCLLRLDFDAEVIAFAWQPLQFDVVLNDVERRVTPHFFVRERGGRALLLTCVDTRPATSDGSLLLATRAACREVDWFFEYAYRPSPVVLGNLRWLSGFRHPRFDVAQIRDEICAVFAVPTPLMHGARRVGPTMRVLPVLYHLLWRSQLVVDLEVPLSESTIARAS